MRPIRSAAVLAVMLAPVAASGDGLKLKLRTQMPVEPKGDRYHTVAKAAEWEPSKTAAVVCDMWDDHWCTDSAKRVTEMAQHMNRLLKELRKQGVLIIHCPSGTMDFYADTPQRKLAISAPKVDLRYEPKGWCHLDPQREPPLPIDDSEGGCDTVPRPPNRQAWTRQHAAIEIAEGDAITDSAEALYLMAQRGIDNVLVMGVHTNMCVLGRPFGIRQLVYQGKNVALVRDMTDTMYDPKAEPKVSHFTGTDLVVSHIERHWCPTVTSDQFLGGEEFRFAADDRPHLVMVIGEDEYETEKTLPPFALKELGQDFRVSTVFASEEDKNSFPGIEVVKDADVVLISVRRRTLPKEQLDVLRKYVAAGKPVVGIRTASHAFELRNGEPPAGHAQWKDFDKVVFGGDYTNHYGSGDQALITSAEGAPDGPLTEGLPEKPVPATGSLYKSKPLHERAVPVLVGKLEKSGEEEPVAWTFIREDGGRSFYTSLGHKGEFEMPWFREFLRDGIVWAATGSAEESISLFNGKDLTGFYTWLKDRGRDSDPKNVFTVLDGVLRISGEEFGCITTEKEYRDYRLIVEFKWGEETFEPRKDRSRDSGILLHGVGEDGVYGGVWMESIECQMIEGGTGDFIVVAGPSKRPRITVEAEERGGQWYFAPEGGEEITRDGGRVNWWGRDPDWKDVKDVRGEKDVEKPVGEWNRLECHCDGDTITNILNGVVVNRATNVTPTKGKIQIQSEGAELFIRRVELEPIGKE